MIKKTLFNNGWYFTKQPLGTTLEDIQNCDIPYKAVNIPHDWLIYQGDNLYEDSTGWYRKVFTCERKDNTCYEIYFEGVYMDTTVYLNGQVLGEWKYGYSSFFFDMTPLLRAGENELLVRVNYQAPNSRWYSGAGIYRNVYIREQPACHFVTDSLYITPIKREQNNWQVEVSAELSQIPEDAGGAIGLEIIDAQGIKKGQSEILLQEAIGTDNKIVKIMTQVSSPALWNLENPQLYTCRLILKVQNDVEDMTEEKFGFRTFDFDQEKGFFLNGVHIKLNGVCEHHDFGALGAAFYKEAMRRKLEILRKMGVNSIRSTHNMPAVGLLELADELGFLVIDEAFDMWERPKTTYDYARFFPQWYQKDIKSWVCRDRNHPCVLFWSIGNEIYDTHADEKGQEWTRLLMEETRKYDPACHAPITIGSNYMPWKNAQKCADIVKFAGYNYGEKYYDQHHKEHPDWYMYGSETASTVQSRGVYHFPYKQSVLADDDEQCSALGNSTTSWGAKSSEMCILTERDREYSMGQFLWTGFDYIGEPTPYHTRNSYFGQIDTAGFEKDSYFIYRSAWTDVETAPFVHVFPYWNFNKGQLIDVRVASNAPIVELFVNGRSQGEYHIDHQKGTILTGNWQIPYEEGELCAVAYDESHKELARESRHSFGRPVKLVMELYHPDRKFTAGAYDLAYVTIQAVDENGYPVEDANDYVEVAVTGAGWLTGLDNGDSTDVDEYKGYGRRMFNGRLLAIIAIGAHTGEIEITANAKGLEAAQLTIFVEQQAVIEGASFIPEKFEARKQDDRQWVRRIDLVSGEGNTFCAEQKEITVTANIEPKEAAEWVRPQDLIWKTVNDAGIDSPLAKVKSVSGYTAKIEAYGDGQFRLRCMVKNGTEKIKVISQLEFQADGLGEANLNPYGFIAGGMYTYAEGDVGNGNEHGVSTARDGRTVVGFDHIDFGSFGSDMITLPVFELGGEECPIEIWEGIPEQPDSEMLAKVIYHKPSIWNVYQEESYTLSRRLKGVTQISFVLHQKIHLKGFSFTPLQKAYEKLYAAENDAVYGDTFKVAGTQVTGIGNNVTLEFHDMDFGEAGCGSVTICGRTHNDKDAIHISFQEGNQEIRQLVEFKGATDESYQQLTLPLQCVKGKKTVRFIFLPGSNFDFSWVQFHRK